LERVAAAPTAKASGQMLIVVSGVGEM